MVTLRMRIPAEQYAQADILEDGRKVGDIIAPARVIRQLLGMLREHELEGGGTPINLHPEDDHASRA